MSHIYIEKRDIGGTLSNWVYCGFWQMHAAEKFGLKSYIHWPQDRQRALAYYYDDQKFSECGNMWDWYFEQPFFKDPPPRDNVWTFEEPSKEQADSLNGQHLYETVARIKEYYKKHLRFHSAVRTLGDEIASRHGIDFSNTIGVMWRGTESIHDGRPRMGIETYFPFLDDILEKEPGLRLMCTAEEETILDPLLRRYKNAFVVDEFFMSPFKAQERGSNPEKYANVSGYRKGMQPALMMYLFSKCKHLVKNRSTVSSIASWLSDGRIVCLAHPENLGHGFDITKAEINGEIMELNR